MASTKRLLPTGECWCGCGVETAIGSFFLPGHDKTAESAVISVEYGGVPGLCKSATLKEVRKHDPQAVMSARSRRRTTASPSRRRWPASPFSGANSRPRRSGWTQRSRQT